METTSLQKLDPWPGVETAKRHYIHDARSRLVQVAADSRGRPGATTHDYYHNTNWQTLEVCHRVSIGRSGDGRSDRTDNDRAGRPRAHRSEAPRGCHP